MKIKNTLTVFIFLTIMFFISSLQAQVNYLWNKTFGGSGNDVGRSVQQTTDGGYIIAGYTESFGGGGYDVWLIRTDESGDTLWTRTFGGSSDDYGYSVQQTKDEGYILVGTTNSFGSGGRDVWLIKTNSSGDSIWTKTFGGIGDDGGLSVQQTTDGGYILAGYITLTRYRSDRWLIKTNTSGDTLWTKIFVGNGTFGGDSGNSVEQTTDGGYIIGGTRWTEFVPETQSSLIKTDSSGEKLWTQDYGPSYGYGNSVRQTQEGAFILVGTKVYSPSKIFLRKIDSNGNLILSKWIGSDNSNGEAVQLTRDGGYIITGSKIFDYPIGLLLVKTDFSGDILWTRTFGAEYDCGYSVQQTTDDGYIITGYRGSGVKNVWLIKTTPEIVDVEPVTGPIPTDFSIAQNYPNPFNPTTTIAYQIPQIGFVTLKVYDLLGREVATLVNEEKPAGSYEVQFNSHSIEGRNLPAGRQGLTSGIYFYRLKAGKFSETKKMILLK